MEKYTYVIQWPGNPLGKSVIKMKQFKQPHIAELVLKGWASNWLGLDFNELHVKKQ